MIAVGWRIRIGVPHLPRSSLSNHTPCPSSHLSPTLTSSSLHQGSNNVFDVLGVQGPLHLSFAGVYYCCSRRCRLHNKVKPMDDKGEGVIYEETGIVGEVMMATGETSGGEK